MNLGDYLPLAWEQAQSLFQAMADREDTIIRGVLQVPEYPPLPPCPKCGEHPQEIAQRTADPGQFSGPFETLLIRFMPCGHHFQARPELEPTPVTRPMIRLRCAMTVNGEQAYVEIPVDQYLWQNGSEERQEAFRQMARDTLGREIVKRHQPEVTVIEETTLADAIQDALEEHDAPEDSR